MTEWRLSCLYGLYNVYATCDVVLAVLPAHCKYNLNINKLIILLEKTRENKYLFGIIVPKKSTDYSRQNLQNNTDKIKTVNVMIQVICNE